MSRPTKFINKFRLKRDLAKCNHYCGKKIYKDDSIKCGEWSGGDQHFCKECFKLNQGAVLVKK